MVNNVNLYASMNTGKSNSSRRTVSKSSSAGNSLDFGSRLDQASRSIGRDDEKQLRSELTDKAAVKLKEKPVRDAKEDSSKDIDPKEKQLENIKNKLEELLLNLQELSKLQQNENATEESGAELLSEIKTAFQELTAFQEKLGKISDTQLTAEIPGLQEQITEFKSLLEGVLSEFKADNNLTVRGEASVFSQKLQDLIEETLPKLETTTAALAEKANTGTVTGNTVIDGQTLTTDNYEVQEAQNQSQTVSGAAGSKGSEESSEAEGNAAIGSKEAKKSVTAAAEETDTPEDTTEEDAKAALEHKLDKAAARENGKEDAEQENGNSAPKEASTASTAKQGKVTDENLGAAGIEQTIPEDGSEITVNQTVAPRAHTLSRAEIINQIVKKAEVTLTDAQSEMKMQLEPENLGKLTLRVAVERGIITAKFTAESYEVKQIIESNFNELKDMLQQKGLEVQNFSVSVGQDNKGDSSDNGAFQQWKETVRLNGSSTGRGGYDEYMGTDTAFGRVANPYSIHNGEFDHIA